MQKVTRAKRVHMTGVKMQRLKTKAELERFMIEQGWFSPEMINRKLQWLLEDLNDLTFVRDHLKVIERDYVIRKVSRFLEEERNDED